MSDMNNNDGGESGTHKDIISKQMIIERIDNGQCFVRERIGRKKAEGWKRFAEIAHADTDKYTGYAICKKCSTVIKCNHNSGTCAMNRHSCKDERMKEIRDDCKTVMRHIIDQVLQKEKDEMFKKRLEKYQNHIKRIKSLIKEANRMADEMKKLTRFKLQSKCPSANSAHRNIESIGNRISIMVTRNNTVILKWSMQLFESKYQMMRDFYREWKFNTKDASDKSTVKSGKNDASPLIDPFEPELFEGTQHIEHSKPQQSQSQISRIIVRIANTK